MLYHTAYHCFHTARHGRVRHVLDTFVSIANTISIRSGDYCVTCCMLSSCADWLSAVCTVLWISKAGSVLFLQPFQPRHHWEPPWMSQTHLLWLLEQPCPYWWGRPRHLPWTKGPSALLICPWWHRLGTTSSPWFCQNIHRLVPSNLRSKPQARAGAATVLPDWPQLDAVFHVQSYLSNVANLDSQGLHVHTSCLNGAFVQTLCFLAVWFLQTLTSSAFILK